MNQHVRFEQSKVQKPLSTGNWQNQQPIKKKNSMCLGLILPHGTKGMVGHAKAN